ncbi:MAG: hypothetical protein HC913_04995 [Microscillaceae bacterium]|nr:hypothetical protein [Microscillaceae bacterium]
MKKKLCTFLFLLSTGIICSYGQMKHPLDTELSKTQRLYQENKVKLIKKYWFDCVYDIVSDSNIVSSSGVLMNEEHLDEKGQTTLFKSFIMIDPKREPGQTSFKRKEKPYLAVSFQSKYERDANGLLHKWMVLDADSNIKIRRLIEHDPEGRLIKYTEYDGEQNIVKIMEVREQSNEKLMTIEYDDKGQILLQTLLVYASSDKCFTYSLFGPKGELKTLTLYYLNEQGLIREQVFFDYIKYQKMITENAYNENGYLIESKTRAYQTDSGETLYQTVKQVFVCSENGLVLEEALFSPIENKLYVVRYSYEYYE